MNLVATLSATDRFALVIDGLCRAVAAQISVRSMTGALILLIWRRLRRINVRFQALAAAIRSGAHCRAQAAPRRAATHRASRPASPGLPREFAWLLRLVPWEAACFAGQLRVVLADPEMVALIAASPRAGSILRPLCRMLGLEAELIMPRAGGANATPDGSSVRVRPRATRPSRGRTPVRPDRPPPASLGLEPNPGARTFKPA